MLWGWWPMSVWPAVAHSLVSIRSRSRWPTCCSRRHRCPRTFLGRCGRWWPRRSPNSRHRPPDASVFGHQLLGLRKALSTPELDAGGSVGVAFDKDDQPTDRPPRPIFGHGSQGRLTTAAGRLPSGGLYCFTASPLLSRPRPARGPASVSIAATSTVYQRRWDGVKSSSARQIRVMETPTTGQYSLLHQAESWLARQVGTDLLEFPGNHMTYLTEPAAVADGLRPLRERSAEPDSRPGIDLGGRVNDPASLVGACRHSRCPPLAHILLGRPGPDLPSLIW
jgi:hypothetical protein